jgi:hypothetical protein
MDTRKTNLLFMNSRLQKSEIRRAKNKARYADWRLNKARFRTQTCRDCGGQSPWCSLCNCYTRTCCVDWGTCMCS